MEHRRGEGYFGGKIRCKLFGVCLAGLRYYFELWLKSWMLLSWKPCSSSRSYQRYTHTNQDWEEHRCWKGTALTGRVQPHPRGRSHTNANPSRRRVPTGAKSSPQLSLTSRIRQAHPNVSLIEPNGHFHLIGQTPSTLKATTRLPITLFEWELHLIGHVPSLLPTYETGGHKGYQGTVWETVWEWVWQEGEGVVG